MSYRAVLFDMDGTLIDSEPLHFRSMAEVVSASGSILSDELAGAITGMSGADCHAFLQRTIGFTPSFGEYIEAKYRNYIRAAASLQLRPGAANVLALLADRQVPYAIVSNSDRILMDVNLNAIGLQRPGQITVSRNDVRRGKPDPEPYLRAAWLLDVPPQECLVVEDSIPGAVAGHAAGMTVIGWPEPHRSDIAFPERTVIADPVDLMTTIIDALQKATSNSPREPENVSR